MKIYKEIQLFNPEGKLIVNVLKPRPGVYILFQKINEEKVCLSINFHSNNLYRAIIDLCSELKRDSVKYKVLDKISSYSLDMVYCTGLLAVNLERPLIKKFNPLHQEIKYNDIGKLYAAELKALSIFDSTPTEITDPL